MRDIGANYVNGRIKNGRHHHSTEWSFMKYTPDHFQAEGRFPELCNGFDT